MLAPLQTPTLQITSVAGEFAQYERQLSMLRGQLLSGITSGSQTTTLLVQDIDTLLMTLAQPGAGDRMGSQEIVEFVDRVLSAITRAQAQIASTSSLF